MGVAGTFFEPHLWNSGNLLLFSRCTNHISITFWIFWLYKSCKKCWSLPLQVFRASCFKQYPSVPILRILQLFHRVMDKEWVCQKLKDSFTLLSVDWLSGIFWTAFDQKRRTDIILENIFWEFWWCINYVALSMSCLIPLIGVHQR